MELASAGAAGTGAITFNGTAATLKLDAAALTSNSYSGAVSNFAISDTLDLAGLSPTGLTASYSGTTLTVGGDTLTNISLVSGLTIGTNGLFFATASDGNGGTDLTLATDKPPTVSITSTAETSSTASQTISGTVTTGGPAVVAGEIVTLTDNGRSLGTTFIAADGSFSAAVTLSNIGANNIQASFTDSLGVKATSTPVTDILTVAPMHTYTPETLTTTIGSSPPVKPFATVSITDNNPGARDNVIVGASGPGTLSGRGLTADGSAGTTTFYELSGLTPANATSELDALVFTPGNVAANSSQTSLFYVGVQSSAGTSAQSASAVTSVTANNPVDTIDGPVGGYATLQGTSGNDIINGNGSYNTIYSNGGNDTINAGSGLATVYAGPGNVTVNLNGYLNTVTGGDGNDTISGSAGNTIISLGNGNNNISTGGFGNSITVGSGTNNINAGAGIDTIVAGAGSNTITLGGFNDTVTLNGGSGTLTYTGVNSVVNLTGTAAISITDLGNALTLAIGSSTQTDTLTGIGNDPYAVVDLKNGVGGYTSTAAIVNALQSDGHGGTMLSIGTESIDFVNTAANQQHASNFKIG